MGRDGGGLCGVRDGNGWGFSYQVYVYSELQKYKLRIVSIIL